MKPPTLSKLLRLKKFPKLGSKKIYQSALGDLQHRMLRIQQGLYNTGRRAVIGFEGFDAAGKGGSILRMTEMLDPRGLKVVPIGPPLPEEKGRHWLYRFWRDLPLPGTITVFDRTWYGRVLVERVDGLIHKSQWKRAYDEINEFEAMLVNDGIELVKIFLAISKDEQLRRFEERLRDPYRRWKIGEADIRARRQWDDYVNAADDMFERTDTKLVPWELIPGEHKWYARTEVLRRVTKALGSHGDWMEEQAAARSAEELENALNLLKA
jgi:polyphosphate kinase 2 (PPK2 family)